MDIETYALAKVYTDKTVVGGGAIKGKNCIITEIEDVGNTHIVHFQWTLDDGTVETDTMTVEDGDLVEDSETNGNIKINGVETQVYDDSELQDIVSTDESTVEGNPINFTTLSAQKSKSTILSLDPIQDLHGYDKPWVGGAGKNKFDVASKTTQNWDAIPGTSFYQDMYIENDILYTTAKGNGQSTIFRLKNFPSGVWSFNYQLSQSYNKRMIIRCFDNGGNNISSEVQISGFTYLSYYSGLYSTDKSPTRNFANIVIPNTVAYFNVGIGYVDDTAGVRVQISNIQMEQGSSVTSYEPYTNICPISGRSEIGILGCGKNLLPVTAVTRTINGVTYTFNSDGTVTLSGTSTGASDITMCDELQLNANTQYTVNGIQTEITGLKMRLGSINQGYDCFSGDVTFPTGSDGKVYNVRIMVTQANATFNNVVVKPMIRLASVSDPTFEPYTKSNDLTISLGQTVYGGTLDVENGVLVVDRTILDLSTLTWYDLTFNRWHTGNMVVIKPNVDAYTIPNIVSDSYEAVTPMELYDNVDLIGITVTPTSDLIIRNGSTTNTPTGNVCYELATPITINLTPQTIKLLEGVNNISVDDSGATITLTYRDGKVATLGDLTSAVDNLDSKIDESKILTDTETGTKYRLVVTDGVLGIEEITEPNTLSMSPLASNLVRPTLETLAETNEETPVEETDEAETSDEQEENNTEEE